ncbi:anti-sigma factor family protein [Streptomyces sp. NPDC093064]|uniref:anti-sigma factor family protein n=1 Tax=unclassified Streptomyces TaxID=2593676 RepID=UPI00343612C5
MSGSRPNPAGRLAEQHLGDRLAALVDGELGHDTRERVLAHVATCPKCKAEVDAQRRLKNVFAQAAPPPPSESFLARLQGLPGGGTGSGGGGSPLGGGGLPGGLSSGSGVFGVERGEQFEFGYVPARPHPAVPAEDRGFRIHPVGRPDSERSALRGLRFAFVAAGAVSLAAVALGGVTTGSAGDTAAEARGSGTGSNVTPARTAGSGAASAADTARRRQSAAPQSGQGQRSSGSAQAASAPPAAPLLPGAVPPGGQTENVMHPLTTPVVAGAAVMSPLIRPLTATPPISLTSWSADPGLTTPGLLATPSPTASSRTAH